MCVMGRVDVAGGVNLGPDAAFAVPLNGDSYTSSGLSLGAPPDACDSTNCGCGSLSGNAGSNGPQGYADGSGCGGSQLDGLLAPAFGRPVTIDCATVANPSQVAPVSPLLGIAPQAVPGPGSAFSQTAACAGPMAVAISGLLITCVETGVTLASICGTVTFYHPASGTKHYTSMQGPGTDCGSHIAGTYSSGSGQNPVSTPVTITVTKLS